jgi:hypothetical protein
MQARLEMLYDDRLDGRIDAAKYDKKVVEFREQRDRILSKVRTAEAAVLPTVREAVDLVALTSKAADLFLEQPAVEQRKLLHLLLEKASWKGGELALDQRRGRPPIP